MQKAAPLITLEGIDFCGKTTQIQKIIGLLQDQNIPSILKREPGGTRISEVTREIILDPEYTEMTDEAELLLYSAARAQLVGEAIVPKLSEGTTVIMDRFYDSSVVYQGHGRGLDLDFIVRLNSFAARGLVPDRTYYLDISIDEMIERKLAAGTPPDRLEQSDTAFYESVVQGYDLLCEEDRYLRINGMKTPEQVYSDIARDLVTVFKEYDITLHLPQRNE